jgi:hypothetical protein
MNIGAGFKARLEFVIDDSVRVAQDALLDALRAADSA